MAQTNLISEIELLLLKNEYRQVINKTETAIRSDSTGWELYYLSGMAYQAVNRDMQAVKMFSKAEQLHPEDRKILGKLGEVYTNLGWYYKAISTYKDIIAADSTDISAIENFASLQVKLAKYNEAILLYKQLLKNDSLNPYLYKQLGFCYSKTDSIIPAVQCYQKALSRNNQDLASIWQLCILLRANRQYPDAVAIINLALQIDSLNPKFINRKATLLFENKQYTEAIPYYEKGLLLNDTTTDNINELGIAYFMTDNFKLAVSLLNEAFKKYVTAKTVDSKNCFYLGLAHKGLNQLDSSIAYLNLAVNSCFPDYMGDFYYHLADAYSLNRKFDLAIQNYKKAYAHNPINKMSLLNIATTIEESTIDKSKALSYYQQFVNEYTGNSQKILEYAKTRIIRIREDMHFEAGVKRLEKKQ